GAVRAARRRTPSASRFDYSQKPFRIPGATLRQGNLFPWKPASKTAFCPSCVQFPEGLCYSIGGCYDVGTYYLLVIAASELIMALATTAFAATCSGSSAGFILYSPVASQPVNFSLSAVNFRYSWSLSLKRISSSFGLGVLPVSFRKACCMALVISASEAICSPSTFAAST